MNLSTFIVLCILILIVIQCIRIIRKDKKSGKSCGGDCVGCGSQSLCHHSQSIFEEYKKELHR